MGIGTQFRSLVFATVLVVSAVAMREKCPPDNLIRPCVCDRDSYFSSYTGTVKCENFTNASDLEEVMARSYDYLVTGLYLKKASMIYVPSSILLSKKTKVLTVEDSVLVSLFDQVPNPENSVTRVFLIGTRLMRSVQWDQFGTFTKLVELQVASVEVPIVGRSFRTHVSKSLTDLVLSSTRTKRIQNDAFQDLGQLSLLRIMKCQVSTVQRSMFAFPSKIQIFDISHNRIQSLPADMFDGMPILSQVWLMGNKITILLETTFGKLLNRNDYGIDLTDNPLECTCRMQWIVGNIKYKEGFVGKCSTPINLTGKEIIDLTTEDFGYCPRNPTIIKFKKLFTNYSRDSCILNAKRIFNASLLQRYLFCKENYIYHL